MHPRLCMYEHYDLINDPFKYKCETSQISRQPFQKNWWMQNITHE
jgi:hypothetical protein